MNKRVRQCFHCGADIWPETEKTWVDEKDNYKCALIPELHEPDPGEDIDNAMAIWGN